MPRNLIAALLIGASLSVAGPASAQDMNTDSTSTDEQTSGYRINESEGGFQLVNHGIWLSPPPIAREIEPAVMSLETRSQRPKRSKLTIGRGSSFRRAAYLTQVYAAEAQYGLPSGLLDALIWTESRYNPQAVSRAGAAGLGQLMPGTARELGVANRFDPRENLNAAARYLKQMLDKFGMVHLALAAYNAGPGAVKRTGGIPLNGETPAYVRNVLAFWGAR
jgi:soluble lytic murein transglycosylase-like protein